MRVGEECREERDDVRRGRAQDGRVEPGIGRIALDQPRQRATGAGVIPVPEAQGKLEPDLSVRVIDQPEHGFGQQGCVRNQPLARLERVAASFPSAVWTRELTHSPTG